MHASVCSVFAVLPDNSTLTYGIMGAVSEIPAGYILETILSVSPEGGVNVPMETWGSLLLAKYGKERYAYRRDLAVQRLGFSTDNGAFYCECTGVFLQ